MTPGPGKRYKELQNFIDNPPPTKRYKLSNFFPKKNKYEKTLPNPT